MDIARRLRNNEKKLKKLLTPVTSSLKLEFPVFVGFYARRDYALVLSTVEQR